MSAYLDTLINTETPSLIYVMDPMCSWCWAFRPVFQAVAAHYQQRLGSFVLLGGLAPDSDEPMSDVQQRHIQGIWRNIEQTTGAQFNHDFWQRCEPRRSTYPACRAVMVARQHSDILADKMIDGIQRAYYQHAKNPSDLATLSDCAQQLGFTANEFQQQMQTLASEERLEEEVEFIQRLGVQGFPTLVLKVGSQWFSLPVDYKSSDGIISAIDNLIAREPE